MPFPPPRRLPPWWMVVMGAVYVGYYVMLVHCDIWRPERPGIDVDYVAEGLLVTAVDSDTPGGRAGLRPGDLITSWHGRGSGHLDLAIIEGNIEFDQPVPVTIERDGRTISAALTFQRESWSYWRSRQGWMLLASRAVQLVSLVLAFVVIFKGRPGTTTYLGGWILATFAVFAVVPPYRFAAVWRSLPVPLGLTLWFPYLSSMAITAVLASFLAVFPQRTLRTPTAWIVVWLPMLAALVLPAIYFLRLVYSPQQAATDRIGFLLLVTVSAGYLIWGVGRLVGTYRALDDVNERRRVRVLANGLLVGCLFGVWVIPMYWLSPSSELGHSLFQSPWMAAGTFLLLAFPISFSYAIVRHRLFDTNLLIRQGLRYALARNVVVSLVPAFFVILVAELAMRHPRDQIADVFGAHAVAYVVVGGLILTVRSQRARWLDALDRRFFRDRYDAQQLLRRVASDLHQAESLEQAAARVTGQLESAFHAEFAAVLARRGPDGGYATLAASPISRAPAPIDGRSTFVALIGLLGRPVEVGLPDARWLARQLPADEVELLRASRLDLIAPVGRASRTPSALLALGPKRSEEPYTDDDLELIAAIAGNLALLERAGPMDASRAIAECPECGQCYGPDTAHCPVDGAVLVPVNAPQVVAGRYRLRRRLGEGGMGTVFAARDEALNRDVAVKLIRHALADRGHVADRFGREARTAASLAHPNVVTVHDFGEADDGPYLVMELLEGTTLRDLMRRELPLPPPRALDILRGVCAALTAAHERRLVHRDLKPENVFLAATGEGDVPKILDFGIAKSHRTPTDTPIGISTAPGVLVGTPHYMSPEQLSGADAGPASDIWALGVMTFEMLTGMHPLGDVASKPDHLVQEVSWLDDTIAATDMPEPWRAFFRQALARQPERRPPTPAAFLSALETTLATAEPPPAAAP